MLKDADITHRRMLKDDEHTLRMPGAYAELTSMDIDNTQPFIKFFNVLQRPSNILDAERTSGLCDGRLI